MKKLLAFALLAASTAGCAVNPVTGKPDFMMVSESQELALGEQNYAPMQQAEGGVHDIDPQLTAYVREVGNKLAAVSDRPLPYEFVVLNNSVPNAWALPGGKIAVNRGLLTELNSEAELAAVLGHEIVHAAAKHSAQQMSRGVILQSAVLATAMVTGDNSFGQFAVGSAAAGAQLLSSTYGRGAELESDKYGMTYMSRAGYDAGGAVTLQETFVRLSEGQDSDWLSGLFASHPPSRARVEANVKTAASLPPGGTLGVDRYQAAMQKTMAAKPAYDACDEGRKALAEEKNEEALALANKAIKLFPEEGHFYALRGDVHLVDGKYDMATKNYDSAIQRRGDYFYYYLRRGMAENELGRTDDAKADLERSIEMLPTGPAHFVLGDIEATQGNDRQAIEHYAIVAKSGGELGEAATQKLQRLQLPYSPGEVIPRRCDADSAGNLVVSVKNTTPWTIEGVQIEVRYTDASGSEQGVRQAISGRIAPDQVASINTGLGPYSGGSCPAEVVSARYAE
ncbi:MAG: M48 family metalloprotease [Gammaproteobacteria bacterium]|jgi:predicted Zn-dependent protease|nr:M48 family metalloprotease [Gammaproteobacteria bacterium]MDH3848372.1 M48 family metalloprotease [Gammaproteobacteria bacterium]MDH3863274.1 M48 family metalloprotease [Gammaproteobacteria bacterium]MDH3904860.1 M48 family metalloprotease [Gammaproteobacteria bacterium]MDH3953410.1 M48 family metalloprotease [Gammaproteobacteria bacterium]